ncbi:CHAP domain-containing protein [Qipengyuania marisflavi]|uniref:CHAP domain-containing protein n=1 Tax=Qipengyuania marisflavi TaxID=2486356 RepID=A0A5S3PBS8_9SPHN|nr:CHAP domain-containing protein [Qipengyuania marisflavi]TMM48689.1 CHAP domain-containing protein [Qipengyuania marisflavi]
MKVSSTAFALVCASFAITPAAAEDVRDFSGSRELRGASDGRELAPYLQCVPYARTVSGVEIYGDARSWWDQAQGRYATGKRPRVGAVMTFRPHRNMQLGHVAAVSRVVDSRRVLLDHANWSPIDGRRGQVEKDVLAIDVSPDNDWSQVRVWYAPLDAVGNTAWPVEGFIYPDTARKSRRVHVARAATPPANAPAREKSSKRFLAAFADIK